MTEPHVGSDPAAIHHAGGQGGDEWVIDGWKYFSSNARTAAFLIVMAITDPDVKVYEGESMFLVPTDTPGVRWCDTSASARSHKTKACTPSSTTTMSGSRRTVCVGGEGEAFAIAQTRLGGRVGCTMPCERSPYANTCSTCCPSAC